jgi:predicted dehydrogenase
MTVRIGLAGTGRRAVEFHAPALAAAADAELAGVWSRSSENAKALADEYDVPSARTFGELLDRCDAVAFALPPAVQPDFASIAAKRHKAVLLERPIAADLAGAEELARAVELAGVVSQVALMWRYSETVRLFLERQVPAIHPAGGGGRVISGALAKPGVPPWRVRRGLLLDHGVDLLDLLDAALGPVVGIQARGELEGWVGLQLDHQVGKYSEATLYATGQEGVHRAEVEIFGSSGTAEVDCSDVVDAEAFATLYRDFAEAVQKGVAPALDAARGLHLQRAIEAAETQVLTGT